MSEQTAADGLINSVASRRVRWRWSCVERSKPCCRARLSRSDRCRVVGSTQGAADPSSNPHRQAEMGRASPLKRSEAATTNGYSMIDAFFTILASFPEQLQSVRRSRQSGAQERWFRERDPFHRRRQPCHRAAPWER
jgi:hypothetical protein